MRKLTIKQEKFVHEYILSGNATDAYRLAYKTSRMKPETINRNAKALLDNNKISTRIKLERKELAKKYEAKAEKTIKRFMQGQEFDVRKLYNKDGTLKKPHELDDDSAKSIVGVKYDKHGCLEYKIIDVKGCADSLCRILGLFNDKLELSADEDLATLILEARARVKR